ncbi:MAG: beta-N-acetylhexosaminidase [candidate division Zixibacteria bacterium]|nr:beta-N-acetylhexosaminidase [candidate division Zixibacteria bacterium]
MTELLPSLIPRPVVFEVIGDPFPEPETIDIVATDLSAEIADYLRGELVSRAGLSARVVDDASQPTGYRLALTVDSDSDMADEGYLLNLLPSGGQLIGATAAGLFRGVQTLLQLLTPRDVVAVAGIPSIRIEDWPAFSWRGMHLDVGRHFFPIENIKTYLDLLAAHKMSVFHWHLTEDQGWRIQIKAYPKLTEVGGWRDDGQGGKYGGYYTQAEIREVVRYASERYITVMPEIEMPGHARAALAAYPEYSCRQIPLTVPGEWGIFEDVFCVGSDDTFAFLSTVLGEVAELFPFELIHVGGDECPQTRWLDHDWCRARVSEAGLSDPRQLQSYFMRRVADILGDCGRRLVGWDEILEGGLPDNAVVMSWRGVQGGIDAVRAGHDVIMSPTSHCYFDYYQAEAGEPKAFNALLPLEKVYEFQPVPDGLTSDEARHVLGGQGNVWTEYMPNWSQVEYMVLPRMCALAETLWSPGQGRAFHDFRNRLPRHCQRLRDMKVNFREPDSR